MLQVQRAGDVSRLRPFRALPLLLLLIPAGCPRREVSEPKPHAGLRLAFAAAPLTLDPMRQTEDVTAAVLSNFYEGLVDLDGDLSLTPRLALQWTNPTERTWQFTLRPDVLFHDGSPFEAADVVASLERAQRLPDGKLAADLRAATARALDARTVELVTDRPRPLLLVRLAALAILPRGTSDTEVLHPVGTGPYRFLSAGEGRRVIQGERWERYWGRVPDAARFTIEVLQEDARNLSGADVVSPLPPAGSSGLRVVVHPTVMTAFLVCDVRPGSPFASLEARRSLGAWTGKRS
jgi:ABC-type transport system substrate-binding protein